MISNHRPSILNRPQRAAPSQATVETSESQFEREQAYWRGRNERQQHTHDRLMRSLYPGTEDKAAAFEDIQRVNEEQQRAREWERQQQLAEQQLWQAPGPSTSHQEERPWTGTSAHYSQEEEAAARRRFAAAVAEENLRMAQAKALAQGQDVRQQQQQPYHPQYSHSQDRQQQQPVHDSRYSNNIDQQMRDQYGSTQQYGTAQQYKGQPTYPASAPLQSVEDAWMDQQRAARGSDGGAAGAALGGGGGKARPQSAAASRAPFALQSDASHVAPAPTKMPERDYPWSWKQ